MRSGSVNLDGNRGHLFFVIGLPQSGKSLFANAWVRDAPIFEDDQFSSKDETLPPYYGRNPHIGPRRPRVVIGGDDVRIGVHNQEYVRTAEGLIFGIIDAAARSLLARGFDVLIDETSTTPETILRYLLIDIDAQPIIINTEESVCLERAKANDKLYLIEPIKLMAEQKRELLKDWPAALERVKARITKRYPNDIIRQKDQ